MTKAGEMTQTVRELLTELAWIEDSIRQVPLETNGGQSAGDAPAVNPDLIALAAREREIIAELRAGRTCPSVAPGV